MTEQEFKKKLKEDIEIAINTPKFITNMAFIDSLFNKESELERNLDEIKSKYQNIPEKLVDVYVENAWIAYRNEKKIEEITNKQYIKIDAINDFKEEDYFIKERVSDALLYSSIMLGAGTIGGILGFMLCLITKKPFEFYVISTKIVGAAILGFLVALNPYMYIKGLVNKEKARKAIRNLGIEETVKEKFESEEIIENIKNKGRVK